MITRTYITKYNTIVRGSERNMGMAPVSDMVYGRDGIFSRALIYFDHTNLKEKLEGGEMPDITKMRHTLKITNASSVRPVETHECGISQIDGGRRMRAVSFDLIFFLIPKEWDGGKGFAYHDDMLKVNFYPNTVEFDNIRLFSDGASNWFQRRNGLPWEHEGVYDTDFLSAEYDKYVQGEDSVVIGMQRFDVGNESIELDVTDMVNSFIVGERENNGIGIAFSPMTEHSVTDVEQYVGFMTPNTPLFFEPYVETVYEDSISDDRSNFALNKRNRLYLYATVGTKLENLDFLPTVTVKDADDEVVRDIYGNLLDSVIAEKYTKGVYYIEFTLGSEDHEPNEMIYDVWDGLSYNGISLPSVELYTTIQPYTSFFNIGTSVPSTAEFTPSIGGINEREQIKRGDVRKMVISPRPNYTQNTAQLVDGMEIRIYVKDGASEFDVVSWDKVEKTYLENYYLLDTSILPPQRYYVDVRIPYGMNSVTHHDVLHFDIVNDITHKKR